MATAACPTREPRGLNSMRHSQIAFSRRITLPLVGNGVGGMTRTRYTQTRTRIVRVCMRACMHACMHACNSHAPTPKRFPLVCSQRGGTVIPDPRPLFLSLRSGLKGTIQAVLDPKGHSWEVRDIHGSDIWGGGGQTTNSVHTFFFFVWIV